MNGKTLVVLIFGVFLLSLVSAQASKIEISPIKDTFKANEKISLKVSIYDSQNNPIIDEINLKFHDETGIYEIEKIVNSGQIVDVDLGEQPVYGTWTVITEYEDIESKSSFNIEVSELAEFRIEGDSLIIKNIGNIKYSKKVYIQIGNTEGFKQPDLRIGEEKSFRLIAPEGTYNIKVTDGTTTLAKGGISLTGKAIGILDERVGEETGITGGIKPDEDNDLSYDYLKKSKSIYVFVLVILGATILLAIERRYQK